MFLSKYLLKNYPESALKERYGKETIQMDRRCGIQQSCLEYYFEPTNSEMITKSSFRNGLKDPGRLYALSKILCFYFEESKN